MPHRRTRLPWIAICLLRPACATTRAAMQDLRRASLTAFRGLEVAGRPAPILSLEDELLAQIVFGDEEFEIGNWASESLSFEVQEQVRIVASGIFGEHGGWNSFQQRFSTAPVPEPGTAACLTLGRVALALRRRR